MTLPTITLLICITGVFFFVLLAGIKQKRTFYEKSVLFCLGANIVLYAVGPHFGIIRFCGLRSFAPFFTADILILYSIPCIIGCYGRILFLTPIKTLLVSSLMIGIVFLIIKTHPLNRAATMFYTPKPLTFEGSSENLSRTQIVPSLDTPITPGKNVIWCASWAMMWKEIQNTLAKEPVIVQGAEEFSQRMNNAPDFTQDLPPDDWYAKAGWVDQGAIQTIHKDMAQRFPRVPTPEFPGIAQDSFMGYAFLTSKIRFKIPYEESERAFVFTDSQGKTTQLPAFGFDGTAKRYSKQIIRLYCENTAPNPEHWGPFHYALDLCADDPAYQVVAAIIPAKATLEETLKYLEEKMSVPTMFDNKITPNDTLQAPELAFHITHIFTEITGHSFKNESLRKSPIDDACLDILFRLDRSGVELISEAKSYYQCTSVDYKFTQPFLLYLKKRGAVRPYFVMWVDNDELLRK